MYKYLLSANIPVGCLSLFDSGGLKESLSYNLFDFYFYSMLFHFSKLFANITDL